VLFRKGQDLTARSVGSWASYPQAVDCWKASAGLLAAGKA